MLNALSRGKIEEYLKFAKWFEIGEKDIVSHIRVA